MHVPYSMDDSEPDLYGSLGGRVGSDEELYPNVRMDWVECTKFYTQNQIDKLKSELDETLGLLSYIYNHTENLPSGVSQQIREQITKDRL